MNPDALTIMEAPGRRLAKLIRPGAESVGYDSTRTVNLSSAIAPTLDALARLLVDLLHRPDRCILRGAIADPARARRVRRLLHADPKTGEAPTLLDVPRSWVALDLDGVAAPAGLDLMDLAACGHVARAGLPDAFHGAACIAAATASHGFKPGLRVRLWFRLSRPVDGAEAVRWLRPFKGMGLDLATLRPVQATYTAAPVFADGMRDPLPHRLARLDGAAAVAVPGAAELAPQEPRRAPPTLPRTDSSDAYARAALRRACVAIATAPVNSRHETAVDEAWGLARLVRANLLTEGEVKRAVDGALHEAGKERGEGEKIAEWALAHRTDSGAHPREDRR
ncbi:hypothetical protein LPC08_01740 [Roseomonas sp. OT10]|uniref:hypothetical protein n=1 Tax=Roseomonas cutis TaxID=2897332 RepID=UPI001E453A81|nr:hypothetical protein [Roseomonas sp. OT10]UFN49393.1 hypothetical protein LPC08_01740 [Roseomonas sp. OT10]